MILTDIRETGRGRLSLYVDGVFRCSVHRDTFLQTELSRGLELTEERLREIEEQDAYVSAREKAFSLLDCREYTERMLYEKLLAFFPAEPAAAATRRMRELGLVNDRDYGERLMSDCMRLRNYSRRRTGETLLRRGLERSLVRELLERYTEETEVSLAKKLILKSYGTRLSSAEGVERTVGAMLRRGFPLESVRRALEEIRDERAGEGGTA